MWRGLKFMADAGGLGIGSQFAAVVLFALSIYENAKAKSVTTYLLMALAFIFIYIGAYLAWLKKCEELDAEREKRGRPDIDMEWHSGREFGSDSILLRNIGADIARIIRVGDFSDPDLHLDNEIEIQSIRPQEQEIIRTGVHQTNPMNRREEPVRLGEFLILWTDERPLSMSVMFQGDGEEFTRTFTFRLSVPNVGGPRTDVLVERGNLSVSVN